MGCLDRNLGLPLVKVMRGSGFTGACSRLLGSGSLALCLCAGIPADALVAGEQALSPSPGLRSQVVPSRRHALLECPGAVIVEANGAVWIACGNKPSHADHWGVELPVFHLEIILEFLLHATRLLGAAGAH